MRTHAIDPFGYLKEFIDFEFEFGKLRWKLKEEAAKVLFDNRVDTTTYTTWNYEGVKVSSSGKVLYLDFFFYEKLPSPNFKYVVKYILHPRYPHLKLRPAVVAMDMVKYHAQEMKYQKILLEDASISSSGQLSGKD